MDEVIEKIQKEVDEQNRIEEIKRQENDKKRMEKEKKELSFDKENLVTFNLSGIENAVKFLLIKLETLTKDLDQAHKEIKSRSYIVDKVHKDGNERDEKIKELEK